MNEKSEKSEKSEKINHIKVKLLVNHTHANSPYSEGAVIEVPEIDGEWLINMKVAEAVKQTVAAKVGEKENV